MKILFAAVFSPASSNTPQAEGFERDGHEVIRFNYRVIASQIGDQARDQQLIDLCEKERPDFLLCSKTNCIHPNTLNACRAFTTVVYWFMDPMSNYTEPILRLVKSSDIGAFGLWEPYQYSIPHIKSCHFINEGYDDRLNIPVESTWPKVDYCFIGNLRSEHRMNYYRQFPFPVIQNAQALDHSHAVCAAKINLNFTEGGCSDRVYKTLASKGFLLTEPWPKMEEYFVPGRDVATFRGVDELKEKIDYYLKNDDERRIISENGYNTVQQFSWYHWTKKIVRIVEEYKAVAHA